MPAAARPRSARRNLIAVMDRVISRDDWIAVFRALIARATEGDVDAAELLFAYAFPAASAHPQAASRLPEARVN